MNGRITGNPIAMAEDESLSITFIDPTRPVEIVSHNLVAGGFYGIGIDSGRIPGETIEQSSDRYSQAYKTEDLYVNGLLNERIMGEALYFSSINWLYQTDAAERIASSILGVVSTRQAEMLAETAIQRDWLFDMPERVNITGVRIDAGRDTSVVNPIDGDSSKIKKYMTLTLYNGSVNEHLDLDIPLGTNTAVSAIKAIQISNQQGIPVYHITSNNINSILPILQVGSDVKTDIQNSVNAGYEATVPEREITYCGWQGVGYIIQDPYTGAGACLITGGAAGASILIAIGILISALDEFFTHDALVTVGEWRTYPSPCPPFREIFWLGEFLTIESQAVIACGAIFLMGYLPIYKRTHTKNAFLSEIAKSKYKILYHVGHGSGGDLVLSNDLLLRGDLNGMVTSGEISGTTTDHFVFVYIDACESALGASKAFDSKCSLGYEKIVFPPLSVYFEINFWLATVDGRSVLLAKTEGEYYVNFWGMKIPIILTGDGSIKLTWW